jgi:hypothetical protein
VAQPTDAEAAADDWEPDSKAKDSENFQKSHEDAWIRTSCDRPSTCPCYSVIRNLTAGDKSQMVTSGSPHEGLSMQMGPLH